MFKQRVNGASRDRIYRGSSACIACPDGSPPNVINSLAYAFYMTNYLSFVIFANKTNCQTSVTSECEEQ